MTTIDNSRYLTILNSDKTNPPPIIQDLAGDKNQNNYIQVTYYIIQYALLTLIFQNYWDPIHLIT